MKYSGASKIVGIFLLFFLLGHHYEPALYHPTPASKMAYEMKSYFSSQNAPQVELSGIPQKFFHPGDDVSVVLKSLQQEGFKIYPVKNKHNFEFENYDDAYIASLEYDRYLIIAYNELRIVVYSSKNKVGVIQGYVFQHGI